MKKTRIIEYTNDKGIQVFRPQRKVLGIWCSWRDKNYWPLYLEYYSLHRAQEFLKFKLNNEIIIHE